jgi:hypothetical protein
MKITLATLALAAAIGSPALAGSPGGEASNRISGDYVEARTASVFAGPCHYNGELTTTGRQAEMVWHIRDGAWNGVSLSGLSAVAAVVSGANLHNESAARRSVLFIDAGATSAQATALAAALQAKCGDALGEVVAVKRAPISFELKGESYLVMAPGVTRLAVDAMPNHACCKMPNLVWYRPLVALQNRRVGYTRESGIADKTLGPIWEKEGQNTAFYGAFTL